MDVFYRIIFFLAHLVSAQRLSALFLFVNFVPLLLFKIQVSGMFACNDLLSRYIKVYMTYIFSINFHFSRLLFFLKYFCVVSQVVRSSASPLCEKLFPILVEKFFSETSTNFQKKFSIDRLLPVLYTPLESLFT